MEAVGWFGGTCAEVGRSRIMVGAESYIHNQRQPTKVEHDMEQAQPPFVESGQ
jgi:hypothetical protein